MAKKILLADDSVTIQKVVELTFMDQDYDVAAVGNGDAAVAALEAGLPDLVIADVHMPGADGYAVCRTAKSMAAGLPVLLLVGTFEPFEESEVAACGADGFLRKPFDSAVLFSEVERLLANAAGSEAPAAEAEVAADDVLELAELEPLPEQEGSLEAADGFIVEDAASVVEAEAVVEEPEVIAVSADDDQLVPETTSPFEIPAPASVPAPVEMASEPEAEVEVAEPAAVGGAAAEQNGSAEEELVERIARRVVELMSERVVREVAWDVIPDLAEVVIRERIRELEADLET